MLILDLDGTILRVNSFPIWAARMMTGRFNCLSPVSRAEFAARAIAAVLRRKAGLSSHRTLKRQLQAIWRDATQNDGGRNERELARHLRHYVRPELSVLIDDIAKSGRLAVIATAAPAEYAEPLGKTLGIAHVLATPRDGAAQRYDNSGERKRDTVLEFLAEFDAEDQSRILFTDHRDDLPLIRVCHSVHWFGSESERRSVAGLVPGVPIHPGFCGGFETSRLGAAQQALGE